MKNKFTSISRLLPLLVLLFGSMNLFAQPANDNCDAPTPITLAADEASIVWVDGDTRMAQDATVLTNTPAVCSGSWYIDDVWFSFSTGATISEGGLVVQTEFGAQADDVAGIGMSFYTNSCATDNIEFQCFSSGDGSTNSLNIVCGLEPNTSYLVRVWSGGNTTANEGTFRIGAYEAEPANSNATVFWGSVEGEGDFTGGLNGWTTTVEAPCDTLDLWQWVPSGSTLESTVANAFGDATSQAPTGCTGAVTFNSDGFDQTATCAASQFGTLVSPVLDLSTIVPAGTAGVSVLFFQTTRQFQSDYFIEYTNDGTTWFEIEINTEFIVNSETFQTWKRVFLPDADLNSTNFQFRFRYDANYYYWIIDDVQLIETEANNLVATTNYAIAPNLLTPASQTDSVRFLIDIENVGAAAQTGSSVNMNIVNSAGAEVYNEDLVYGNIPANFYDANRIFPGHFLPDAAIDTYTGTYTVSADEDDFDLTDNSQSFSFQITDSIFAKEEATNLFGASPQTPPELTWTMATTYFVRNEVDPNNADIKYECSSVLIGLENLLDNVGGFVTIYLYEWEDVNNDGISQSGERDGSLGGNVVGNFTYEILDGTDDVTDLLVSLENFIDGGEPIQLKENTNYVLAAGLTSAGTSKIELSSTNDNDLLNTGFLSDSLTTIPRFGSMWNTTSDDGGFNNDLTLLNVAPRMRMHIGEYMEVSVNNPLDEANKVNVYPNPATDVVNMELDLVENLNNAVVRIVDLNARNVMEVVYDNLSSQTLTYSVANLATGTYFLKIQSDKGYITKKFTIVK
ncbi:MAG: T9SS type A sorting domain-containing protein [Saprospiraceae bacterium]